MFEMFNWSKNDKGAEVIPDEVRELFRKTNIEPLMRQIEDRRIAARLGIDPAINQLEDGLKELVQEEEAVKSKRVQIERTFEDIKSKLTAAKQDCWSIHSRVWECRQKIEGLKADRARYGSPLLTEFKWELIKKWEVLRNAGRDEEREGRKKSLTGKTTRSIWTNRPSVEIAIAYIRTAMAEAEKMMSEPIADAEIKTRLDVLRQGIPLTGEWVVTDVKPVIFTETVAPRYGEIDTPSYF